MGMLELCLLPLLAALPQDPQAAGSPGGVDPARWLPQSVPFAVVLGAYESQRDALAATASWQILHSPAFADVRAMADDLLAGACEPLGMSRDDLGRAFGRGASFGVFGTLDDGMPDMLLVADVGAAKDRVTAALERLAGGTAPAMQDGAKVWRIGSWAQPAAGAAPAAAAHAALDGDHLVVATNDQRLLEGLACVRATGTAGSLAAEKAFQTEAADGRGAPLLAVFARPERLFDLARASMPIEQAESMERLSQALHLEAMRWVMSTWRLEGTSFTGRTRVATSGLGGLFAALAGTPGKLAPELAGLAPADTIAFGAAAVNLGQVVDQLLVTASAVARQAPMLFEGVKAQIRESTEVDLSRDVLGALAGRIVSVQTEHGAAAMFELADPRSFASTYSRLVRAAGPRLEAFDCGAAAAHRVAAPGMPFRPAFAVVDRWLVVASAEQTLTAVAARIREPKANTAVTKLLNDLPAGATWVSWREPRAAAKSPFGDTGAMPEIDPAFLAGLPPAVATLRLDDEGVLHEVRSSMFGVQELAAVGAFASMAAPSLLAGHGRRPGKPSTGGRPRNLPAPAPQDDQPGADPVAVNTLQVAERSTKQADWNAAHPLIEHADPRIAARAAWVCGVKKSAGAVPALLAAAARPEASVRVQAMAALQLLGAKEAVAVAITGLDDEEPAVRVLSAQILGRLKHGPAVEPLLAMLHRAGSTTPRGRGDDVVAALVALHDIGDAKCLLPAASGLRNAHSATSQGLTFLFQALSPTLPPKEEATVLAAVLDDEETLLRRYAIQRLGELRDPTTALALEKRLAVEGAELQPLLRVTLSQVRGDVLSEEPELWTKVQTMAKDLWAEGVARWEKMDDQERMITAGTAGGVLFLLLLIRMVRRRRRRAAANAASAAEAAALVAPSEDLLEQTDAEWSAPGGDELVGAGNDRGRSSSRR